MTYVTEKTSNELRAHVRRLQAMRGWHHPLVNRLYKEIIEMDSEIRKLHATIATLTNATGAAA